jgi:hypothetical protein
MKRPTVLPALMLLLTAACSSAPATQPAASTPLTDKSTHSSTGPSTGNAHRSSSASTPTPATLVYPTSTPTGEGGQCIYSAETAGRIVGNPVQAGSTSDAPADGTCWYQPTGNGLYALDVTVASQPDPCGSQWQVSFDIVAIPGGCLRRSSGAFMPTGSVADSGGAVPSGRDMVLMIVEETLPKTTTADGQQRVERAARDWVASLSH